jgi:hypothetical protein
MNHQVTEGPSAGWPQMYALRQSFPREQELDIAAAVRREFHKLGPQLQMRSGARVAISVGSRGICNLDKIVRAVVDNLKTLGAQPFIFPAMGSHGGGTAEGQRAVLEHYGISQQTMDCPILASMEVVELGRSEEGIPVFLDKYAAGADHIVVLNRVKPHTEFKGEIESGLMKMLLIGMGKHEGAKIYHRAFMDYSFDTIVQKVAGIVLSKAKILMALGVVENAYEETALVRGLLPQEIVEGDRALLRRAKELMPRLPFDEVDVLIVDEIGKNISGAGMDPNITGRFDSYMVPGGPKPRVKRIYVRDLTPESMGNAAGIGCADFIHRAVVRKMDLHATNINSLTALVPDKCRVPIVCETDREALDYCFATIGLRPPRDARVLRIRNTLHVTEINISQAYLPLVEGRTELKLVAGPVPLACGADNNLEPMLKGRDEAGARGSAHG